MQADQWHERWRGGKIAFHAAEIDSALKRHWPTLAVARGTTVLVPFCGKSLDLLWLRDQGHNVVGVEVSEIAVESFLAENGVDARRVAGNVFIEYRAAGMRLFCGDLFNSTPQMLGTYAAVYDRAALIALPPELQHDYALKLAQLTSFSTQTLLIALEYPQHEMRGPPYSMDAVAVDRLYATHHKIQVLGRTDIWASDPLRARGITRLHEVCYRLTRL